MGTWFSRNGVQGTTEQAPAGHPVYVVTHVGGAIMKTDVGSLAQRIAIEWATTPPAAPQIVSPLPAVERCTSGLASGATLTMPTEPQSARLRAASIGTGQLWRGPFCDVRMMRALARRGWFELDNRVRPSYGTLTDAGRRALARYESKHGVLA